MADKFDSLFENKDLENLSAQEKRTYNAYRKFMSHEEALRVRQNSKKKAEGEKYIPRVGDWTIAQNTDSNLSASDDVHTLLASDVTTPKPREGIKPLHSYSSKETAFKGRSRSLGPVVSIHTPHARKVKNEQVTARVTSNLRDIVSVIGRTSQLDRSINTSDTNQATTSSSPHPPRQSVTAVPWLAGERKTKRLVHGSSLTQLTPLDKVPNLPEPSAHSPMMSAQYPSRKSSIAPLSPDISSSNLPAQKEGYALEKSVLSQRPTLPPLPRNLRKLAIPTRKSDSETFDFPSPHPLTTRRSARIGSHRSSLAEKGWLSAPASSPDQVGYFPLEYFDDWGDIDFNKPNWINSYPDAIVEEEHRSVLSAASKWFDTEGKWSWRDCHVLRFDRPSQLFLIRWQHSGKTKLVSRLNLLFKGEAPEQVSERIDHALRRRRQCEATLHYLVDIDHMPKQGVPELPTLQLDKIIRRVGEISTLVAQAMLSFPPQGPGESPLKPGQVALPAIEQLKELFVDLIDYARDRYLFAQNMILYDYTQPFTQAYNPELVMRPVDPPKPVAESGVVALPPYNFSAKQQWLQANLVTGSPVLLEAMFSIWGEVLTVGQQHYLRTDEPPDPLPVASYRAYQHSQYFNVAEEYKHGTLSTLATFVTNALYRSHPTMAEAFSPDADYSVFRTLVRISNQMLKDAVRFSLEDTFRDFRAMLDDYRDMATLFIRAFAKKTAHHTLSDAHSSSAGALFLSSTSLFSLHEADSTPTLPSPQTAWGSSEIPSIPEERTSPQPLPSPPLSEAKDSNTPHTLAGPSPSPSPTPTGVLPRARRRELACRRRRPHFKMDVVAIPSVGEVHLSPGPEEFTEILLSVALELWEHVVELPAFAVTFIVDDALRGEIPLLDYVLLPSDLHADFLHHIDETMSVCKEAVQEFIKVFIPFLTALGTDVAEYQEMLATQGEAWSVDHWAAVLQEHGAILKKIQLTVPDVVEIGPFSIHCAEAKAVIYQATDTLRTLVLTHFSHLTTKKREYLEQEFHSIKASLEAVPSTPQELIALTTYLQELPQQLRALNTVLMDMMARYDVLYDNEYLVSEEDFAGKWNVYRLPMATETLIASAERSVQLKRLRMIQDLRSNQRSLSDRVEILAKQCTEMFKYDDIENAINVADKSQNLVEQLQDCQRISDIHREHEALFDFTPSQNELLNLTVSNFEPLASLWTTASDWGSQMELWLSSLFRDLNAGQVETFVHTTVRTLAKATKGLKAQGTKGLVPLRAAGQLKEMVDAFRKKLPLIVKLRHPGIRRRHWEKLVEITGLNIPANGAFSVTYFLELGLEKHMDTVTAIADVAINEYTLETTMDRMEQQLRLAEFEHMLFRDSESPILRNVDAITEIIDDQRLTCKAVLTSPFVAPLLERVKRWASQLDLIQNILEEWLYCQRKWVYLYPIFQADDIKSQLPAENRKFMAVDSSWLRLMKGVVKRPQVILVCMRDRLLEQFQELHKMLDAVSKGFAEYLEIKRARFPRFYFLSDGELLDILARAREVQAIIPYLPKCFDSVSNLLITDEKEISALVSAEGEVLQLLEPVPTVDNELEKWMNGLETQMQRSVQHVLGKCLTAMGHLGQTATTPAATTTHRKDLMLEFNTQAVLTANQILFTQQVNSALLSGDARTLRALLAKAIDNLNFLTAAVSGSLTPVERVVFGTLLVLEVHNRDILRRFMLNKITTPDDIDWLSQLKYYWEDGHCIVRILHASLDYAYEYLGCCSRLVVTPLTERVFQSVAVALHEGLGCSPSGPAGTGKSESCKDLAKAVAKQCIVFNCSSSLDIRTLTKLFTGLVTSGAWAVLDEINLIPLAVLSVMAGQIRTIQSAVKAGESKVLFEGSDVHINASYALFITMNPSYANRTTLPDNLKACFRPIAMMAPDYVFIVEILLFAEGFVDASGFSKKIVSCYQLCNAQLSRQHHYDFGLRALKTVVTLAGVLRREMPQAKEVVTILNALKACTVPKLDSDDTELFDAILTDIFPEDVQAQLEQEKHAEKDPILTALEEVCELQGLEPHPYLLSKALQLYHTTQTRHGAMVIGKAGAGKTTIIHTLARAVTALAEHRPHTYTPTGIRTLNPKAVTVDQLYGHLDPETLEWSDGIISRFIRSHVLQPNESPEEETFLIRPQTSAAVPNGTHRPPTSGVGEQQGAEKPEVKVLVIDEEGEPQHATGAGAGPGPGEDEAKNVPPRLQTASSDSTTTGGMRGHSGKMEGASPAPSPLPSPLPGGPSPPTAVEGVGEGEQKQGLSIQTGTSGFLPHTLPNPSRLLSDNVFIVLDGHVDSQWVENLNTCLDDSRLLCLANGERLKIRKGVTILFELDSLETASPATISRCGMVYLDQAVTGFAHLPQKWLKTLPTKLKEFLPHIDDALMRYVQPVLQRLVSDAAEGRLPAYFSPCGSAQMLLSHISCLFAQLIPQIQPSVMGQSTLGSFALLPSSDPLPDQAEPQSDDESSRPSVPQVAVVTYDKEALPAVLHHIVIFGVLCSVVLSLPEELRQSYSSLVTLEALNVDFVAHHLPPAVASSTPSTAEEETVGLHDFAFSIKMGVWCDWKQLEASLGIRPPPFFRQEIVSTLPSRRLQCVITTLLQGGQHVLLLGPPASGKSVLLDSLFAQAPDQSWLSSTHYAMASLDAKTTQKAISSPLERRRRGVYGPPVGKRLISVVEDLSLVEPEMLESGRGAAGGKVLGSQAPVELMRHLLDAGFWYEAATNDVVELVDVQLVLTASVHTPGHHSISPRLLRHFHILHMTDFTVSHLRKIFSAHLAAKGDFFLPDLQPLTKPLANAFSDTYLAVRDTFKSTPEKVHYSFNIRDFVHTMEGLFSADPGQLTQQSDVIRLWFHECLREYGDRLTTEEECRLLAKLMDGICQKRFGLPWGDIFVGTPSASELIFTHVDPSGISSSYRYERNFSTLQGGIATALSDYNSLTNQPMDLVLFKSAVMHMIRITRILKRPGGHALVLAVGGSGRQSVIRLAIHLADLELRSLTIVSGYGHLEFRENLKKIVTEIAHGKEICLLVTDMHIVHPLMLEDLDMLMRTGQVTGLFEADELNTLLGVVNKTTGVQASTMSLLPRTHTSSRQPLTQLQQEEAARSNAQARQDSYKELLSLLKRNFHVALCMSPFSKTFASDLRKFSGLTSCTTSDWFLPWPSDALESVAESAFKQRAGGILAESQQPVFARLCRHFHNTVEQFAKRYLAETQRHHHVTPTKYIELLEFFVCLLRERKEENQTLISRYSNGSTKLLGLSEEIAQLQEQLEKDLPRLASTQAEITAMLGILSEQQVEADATRSVVLEEEKSAAAQAEISQQIQHEAEADLAEALPAYEESIRALSTLNRKDITEIRSFNNPPIGMTIVIEAVCIMLGRKPRRVDGPRPGTKVEDYWPEARIMLNDAQFIKKLMRYDKENIPQDVIDSIQAYIKNPKFLPEEVEKVSRALRSLCEWVRAVEHFHWINKVVEPKRRRLQETQAVYAEHMQKLENSRQKLKQVEDNIAELIAEHESAEEKKRLLEKRVELSQLKLDRAHKLMALLGGEQSRWGEEATRLRAESKNIGGDALLAAAMVVYVGNFNRHFRDLTLREWQKQLKRAKIPFSRAFSLVQVLGKTSVIRGWHVAGLPHDHTSVESAVIATASSRFPLLADPQDQARAWLKKQEYKHNLQVTRFTDENFFKILESALLCGQPLMVEGVREEIPPQLNPLLMKQFQLQNGVRSVKLGDKSVQVAPDFRLYLITPLANPRYSPEVLARVNIVNFTITKPGLQEQLLLRLVGLERPDLEKQRAELHQQMTENSNQLQTLEDEMLLMISESEEDFLGDERLVTALTKNKKLADDISRKVKIAEQTAGDVERTCDKYQEVAGLGATLYFCVADLQLVEHMYQFSLKAFLQLFQSSVENAPEKEDILERLAALSQALTWDTYRHVCGSIFERHKLLFAFLMTARMQLADGKLTSALYNSLTTEAELLSAGAGETVLPNTLFDSSSNLAGIVESEENLPSSGEEGMSSDSEAGSSENGVSSGSEGEDEAYGRANNSPASAGDGGVGEGESAKPMAKTGRSQSITGPPENLLTKRGSVSVAALMEASTGSLASSRRGSQVPLSPSLSANLSGRGKYPPPGSAKVLQKPDWLGEGQWADLITISGLEELQGLAHDIASTEYGEMWRFWILLATATYHPPPSNADNPLSPAQSTVFTTSHSLLTPVDPAIVSSYTSTSALAQPITDGVVSVPPLPSYWNTIPDFAKVLVTRILRPEDTITVVRHTIREALGLDYCHSPPFDIDYAFARSALDVPIVFTLSPGFDPMNDILQLAERKKMSADVMVLSLGQGQAAAAQAMLNQAFFRGSWVVLQNCHVMAEFLPQVEHLIETVPADRVHHRFRLWLTTMPSDTFPVSILHNAVVLTKETPTGMQASLTRTYMNLPSNHLSNKRKEVDYQRFLFGLAFLHAVLLERHSYGPLGWTGVYGFDSNDFQISCSHLKAYFDKVAAGHTTLDNALEVVRHLLVEVNYGGRITDKIDGEILKSLTNSLLSAQLLQANFHFPALPTFTLPRPQPVSAYLNTIAEYIPATVSPPVLGLSPVAGTARIMRIVSAFLASWTAVHPTAAAAARSHTHAHDRGQKKVRGKKHKPLSGRLTTGGEMGSNTSFVASVCARLLSIVPQILEVNVLKGLPLTNPFLAVLRQEVLSYNALLSRLHSLLTATRNALQGFEKMTTRTERAMEAVGTNRVPLEISQHSYPSTRPLFDWVRNLHARVAYIQSWLDLVGAARARGGAAVTTPVAEGAESSDSLLFPNPLWLPGLYHARSFLTAVLQHYARRTGASFDTLALTPTLLSTMTPEALSPRPNTVYLYGLFVEAGVFDPQLCCVTESESMAPCSPLPVLQLTPSPATAHNLSAGGLVPSRSSDGSADPATALPRHSVPLYRTRARAGVLDTSGVSSNYIISLPLPIDPRPVLASLFPTPAPSSGPASAAASANVTASMGHLGTQPTTTTSSTAANAGASAHTHGLVASPSLSSIPGVSRGEMEMYSTEIEQYWCARSVALFLDEAPYTAL